MKFAQYKAEKGVIEIELALKDEIIVEIRITGDFFIYPEEAIELIENTLTNSPIDKQVLTERLESIYKKEEITTPGIKIVDWVSVIHLAINS